jgi:hypothetical protein
MSFRIVTFSFGRTYQFAFPPSVAAGGGYGAVLDRGGVLAATIAALVAGFARSSAAFAHFSFYMPLLVLAVKL